MVVMGVKSQWFGTNQQVVDGFIQIWRVNYARESETVTYIMGRSILLVIHYLQRDSMKKFIDVIGKAFQLRNEIFQLNQYLEKA
jgi:hypothetical protein